MYAIRSYYAERRPPFIVDDASQFRQHLVTEAFRCGGHEQVARLRCETPRPSTAMLLLQEKGSDFRIPHIFIGQDQCIHIETEVSCSLACLRKCDHTRITSYNVCYTKLLRDAQEAPRYGGNLVRALNVRDICMEGFFSLFQLRR